MPIPSALPHGTALFIFHGRVVRGKRLGSRLGFPTANIAYDPQSRAWPREGVYVGVAQLDGESRGYVCIINQGRHPTVPEGMATVEAHLLGHAHRDLYGLGLTLAYCLYLRPEQTFPSLEALREQLDRDRLSAVRWAGGARAGPCGGAGHGSVFPSSIKEPEHVRRELRISDADRGCLLPI